MNTLKIFIIFCLLSNYNCMCKKNKISSDDKEKKDKHEETLKYWTKERMKNAKPIELEIDSASNKDSVKLNKITNQNNHKNEEE